MTFKVFGKKINTVTIFSLSLLVLLLFCLFYGCTICREGNRNMNDDDDDDECLAKNICGGEIIKTVHNATGSDISDKQTQLLYNTECQRLVDSCRDKEVNYVPPKSK